MKKKLWGGRFTKKIDPLVEEFTRSIQYDYKLAECDLIGSILHVSILKEAGYLTNKEMMQLEKALLSTLYTVAEKKFEFDKNAEDIHTNIQNTLEKKVGDLALKLHTARSRNDQVAFATKLYCRFAVKNITINLEKDLIPAIEIISQKNKNIIIPGFTHMQHAQPVYLKDYLGAYREMFKRDRERLETIFKSIEITMGSGALAGTPIDALRYGATIPKVLEKYYKNLNVLLNIKPTANSLDTVSDRDFVIEIISALSIIAMHLSRLSEDLIIWSTKEFSFVDIDESYCTGSSLMPQKKNADTLELARGYTSRLYGNLVSVLVMMKGLPLAYNRDMQLDKEPLFNSLEIVLSELKVLAGLVKTLKFNKSKIEEHLKDESLYATDIVYYLVDRKVPFKEAHTIVGKLIKYSLDNKAEIKEIPETILKKFSHKFVKKEIVKLFDPELSVKSKRSIKR